MQKNELSPAALELRRAYQREWARNHKDKVRECKSRWQKAHPEKVSEYKRRYWEKKAREAADAEKGI